MQYEKDGVDIFTPISIDAFERLKSAGVKISYKHKTFEEDKITCPICGYEESDSSEAPDEDKNIECPECGNIFEMIRINLCVVYNTYIKSEKPINKP